MAFELTPALKKALLGGKRRHKHYARAVALSDEMLLLTEGKGAKQRLESYRPSEPAEVRAYRITNFRLITKVPISKVLNSLAKIGRADDFKISYPEQRGVLKGQALKDYCETNFPVYDSLTNWLFSLFLKSMATEPNGWVCWLPQEWEWDTQSYAKPTPFIYRAEQVLDWAEGQYVFVLLDETVEIKDANGGESRAGKVYLLITDTQVIRFWDSGHTDPTDNAIIYQSAFIEHGFGHPPAYRLGGKIVDASHENIYESFLAGGVPYWTEALIDHSDKQGSKKRHAYPESATWGGDTCKKCSGMGQYIQHGRYGAEAPVSCGDCAGSGRVSSPHSDLTVRPTKVGENPAPWPPKVYIQKDLGPLEFLSEDIERSFKKAYSALHMEFLDEGPLAQSGTAKLVDREELNTFLYDVARHLVENVLRPAYWYIGGWRYGWDNPAALEAIVPALTVPEHFDIVGLATLEAEIASATTANVEPRIVTNMNIRYAEKRFRNDPVTVNIIRLCLELDPLAGKSEDEKMTILSSKGVSLTEYVLSANIETLIRISLEDNETFAELSFKEQRAALMKQAEAMSKANQLVAVPVVPPQPVQ